MFIFYRFLCFKSSVNTLVLVLLCYQKLLKYISILVNHSNSKIKHYFWSKVVPISMNPPKYNLQGWKLNVYFCVYFCVYLLMAY
jgi:hypothetical protein